jgi:uncharacterized membrane protein
VDSHRAESFSDGVFAVAITLLVFNLLGIGAKELSYGTLGAAWPRYAAYAVSFLTIGIMWINHHDLFANLSRVDRPLLVLNLVLLLGVVAIPFPTALVAEHLTGRYSAGGSVAAVVYGAVMIVISAAFNGIWAYVVRNAGRLGTGRSGRRLLEETPRLGSRAAPGIWLPRWSVGFAGYLTGVLIAAFLWPAVALAVYALLAIYYLFNHLPAPPGAAPAGIPEE